MPKRSLNRVLGANSLELKCLLLFGLFLLVVITASFLMYWRVTGKVVKQQNPMTGKLLVDQVLLITHWSAMANTQDFKTYLQILSQKLSDQKFKWRFIGRPDDPDNRQDPSRLPKDDFERGLLSDYLHNARRVARTRKRTASSATAKSTNTISRCGLSSSVGSAIARWAGEGSTRGGLRAIWAACPIRRTSRSAT